MNLLNPQAIVIGGGVMASGDLLLDADSGGGAAIAHSLRRPLTVR